MKNITKRSTVKRALQQYPDRSDRFIAEMVGVSNTFVGVVRKSKVQKGFVYFILCPRANMVKIGFTNNLDERIKSHRTSCPFPVVFLKAVEGSFRLEREIHGKFSDLRAHLEWFVYSDELAEFINSLK